MSPLGRIDIRKVTFILLVILFTIFLLFKNNVRQALGGQPTTEKEIDLSDCKHIYLDVGTNIGVQIRKLFEPQLYPGAKVTPYFDRHFGSRRAQDVCAVGFEPNPRFENQLKDLERTYNACGFKTKIFTRTAVSTVNKRGGANFWSDGEEKSNELGGTILGGEYGRGESLSRGAVDLLRLSDFILQHVKSVRGGGSVLMKMDIEGSELEVLTDLLLSGALSRVDLAFVEWHLQDKHKTSRGRDMFAVKSLIENTNAISQKYNLTPAMHVISMDDETYYNKAKPLPKC